jgi:hypothetical protein
MIDLSLMRSAQTGNQSTCHGSRNRITDEDFFYAGTLEIGGNAAQGKVLGVEC